MSDHGKGPAPSGGAPTPIGLYANLFIALAELSAEELAEFREWIARHGDPAPKDAGPPMSGKDRSAFRSLARRFQRGRRRVPAGAWARTLTPEAVAVWAENAPAGARRVALWRVWGALDEDERRGFLERAGGGGSDQQAKG